MIIIRRIAFSLLMASFTCLQAVEVNPGYPENIKRDGKEAESPLRRGEVIFFISYPFTFLASAASYAVFGYGIAAIEGKSNFTLGGAFYAVSAITAGFLSLGIALDDHYTIKAQTKNNEGTPAGYLSLSFRF